MHPTMNRGIYFRTSRAADGIDPQVPNLPAEEETKTPSEGSDFWLVKISNYPHRLRSMMKDLSATLLYSALIRNGRCK